MQFREKETWDETIEKKTTLRYDATINSVSLLSASRDNAVYRLIDQYVSDRDLAISIYFTQTYLQSYNNVILVPLKLETMHFSHYYLW